MERMYDLVVEAKTVIFLGFAFHEQNMNLMTPYGRSSKARHVLATALGNVSDEHYVLKEWIKNLLGGSEPFARSRRKNEHPLILLDEYSDCNRFLLDCQRRLSFGFPPSSTYG